MFSEGIGFLRILLLWVSHDRFYQTHAFTGPRRCARHYTRSGAKRQEPVQRPDYAPSFNAADKARIASATAYLQALGTAHGRFEQTDYKGRKSAGNWYLARPGKMRFEYDAPTSLLIVSNGKTVSMWDPRLQTFDQYPCPKRRCRCSWPVRSALIRASSSPPSVPTPTALP